MYGPSRFAPHCFVRNGAGAEVQLGHDGECIGRVSVVVSNHDQHVAEFVVEGDESLLDRVREGQGVSLDARSLDHDDDQLARTRRHHLVELRHVAIAADHETPWYPNARILSVRRLSDRALVDDHPLARWRSAL